MNEVIKEIMIVVITAAITNYFTKKSFRQESKEQYRAKLGERIGEAYINIRELISEVTSIEIYEVEETKNVDGIMSSRGQTIYPSFMCDNESIYEFANSIRIARTQYEPYLDLKTAAYLYGIETYLMTLALYMRDNKLFNVSKEMGCLVIVDVIKWNKTLDKHIVKKINRQKYKLYSQTGRRWEKEKRNAERIFLSKSQLNLYLKGESSFPLDIVALAAKKQ